MLHPKRQPQTLTSVTSPARSISRTFVTGSVASSPVSTDTAGPKFQDSENTESARRRGDARTRARPCAEDSARGGLSPSTWHSIFNPSSLPRTHCTSTPVLGRACVREHHEGGEGQQSGSVVHTSWQVRTPNPRHGSVRSHNRVQASVKNHRLYSCPSISATDP